MKKNLYSLMLSEDVVRAVDAMAHRTGTNRSALVNQILADYVAVPTPERRINDIFQAIEELVTPSRELVPFFAPNSPTMSLKSSLAYKYRPTVKYELDLNGGGEDAMGDLSVIFRTQSAGLIAAMSEFFRLWGNLSWGGIPNDSILSLCKESLANSGNYYNLMQLIADDGRIVPILFGTYSIYAERGLLPDLNPSRDNVFFYTMGKTMESARIDNQT